MRYLFLLLLCALTFGCFQDSANNQTAKTTFPTASPVELSKDTAIEENLVFLDNSKKGKAKAEDIQSVKLSLDYLTEHTTSTREEIADITNKIIPELQKKDAKTKRKEFLFVCKGVMIMNNVEGKLGEKPDFAYLAAVVAADLDKKH